jgi:hypothetical protein
MTTRTGTCHVCSFEIHELLYVLFVETKRAVDPDVVESMPIYDASPTVEFAAIDVAAPSTSPLIEAKHADSCTDARGIL